MATRELTAERVRELLDYDPATGQFVRRVALARRSRVGDVGGYLQRSTGYRRIAVDGKVYRANRVAWLHFYGEWPRGHLDHINGVRDDDRIENLRDGDRRLNNQNRRRPQRNNTSGFLGVTRDGDLWRAQIAMGGKKLSLGTHITPELAHEAYVAGKRRLHAGCTI